MVLQINTKLTSYFGDIKESVVKNAFIVLQGIFKAKSVNLNEVKLELPEILDNPTTEIDSHYKRLTRFFNLPDEEKRKLSESLLCVGLVLLGNSQKNLKKSYLTLDGTKWEYNDTYIHLLTLCIVVDGVSIPIWWEDLSKKGHSSQAERLSFFRKALFRYDLRGKCLLADREYIGRDWLSFLRQKGIDFVIRLKKGIYQNEVDAWTARNSNKETTQHLRYSGLEHRAKQPKYYQKGVAKEVIIEKRKYLLVIVRNQNWKTGDNPKEELLYLLTTLNKRTKAIKAYKIRWSIECCFKCLKSKGFDLEAINVKGDEKIFLMVALVSFLYTLCVIQGLKIGKKARKSDLKRFKDGSVTLTKSYFKRGKEELKKILFRIFDFVTFINKLLMAAKPPINLFVQ
jgi:hypothetical protein